MVKSLHVIRVSLCRCHFAANTFTFHSLRQAGGASWQHASCLSEGQFYSLISLSSSFCDILTPSLPLLYQSGSGNER